MRTWPTLATHHDWLRRHADHLLTFGRASARPGGGAYWLDDDGRPDPSRGVHTWITARMTHVYSLGALLGIPGCAPIAQNAMAGLTGVLHDADHGGWYPSVAEDGAAAPGKSCYDHVFVVLTAASACHAGIPGAPALFDEATRVLLDRFWDEQAGACVDLWDTAFEHPDPYRGANANMHGVEAMLSAAGLTGDDRWLDRAARVCGFFADAAEANGWRLPEHYDADWQVQLEHNRDRPADQFKPYGATIGHAFEWARLFVHLAASPAEVDSHRFVAAATALFEQAVADGWAPDGRPGFVYTTDWEGRPVVADRLHWVVTEALGAASALFACTGDEAYADDYRAWWDHADRFHLDHARGSWFHQLDADNRPSASVWSGKPDLYHAFQAALIPTLPLYPMLAAALDR